MTRDLKIRIALRRVSNCQKRAARLYRESGQPSEAARAIRIAERADRIRFALERAS